MEILRWGEGEVGGFSCRSWGFFQGSDNDDLVESRRLLGVIRADEVTVEKRARLPLKNKKGRARYDHEKRLRTRVGLRRFYNQAKEARYCRDTAGPTAPKIRGTHVHEPGCSSRSSPDGPPTISSWAAIATKRHREVPGGSFTRQTEFRCPSQSARG